MSDIKIHDSRPNDRPTIQRVELPPPSGEDDDAKSYLPAYWHIVDDRLGRIGRSGRIVGPLALAATASGGCAGGYAISGIIIASLIGLCLYLGLGSKPKQTEELPSYFHMFAHGIENDVWHRYLQKIVNDSHSRGIRVRRGKLYSVAGTELSLMQIAVRRGMLDLPTTENRRAVIAAASREYLAPDDLGHLKRTFDFFDSVALSLNAMYPTVQEAPMPASIPGSPSPEYAELAATMQHYQYYIKELADIYEPAVLARYYAKRGRWDEARTMVKLISGKKLGLAAKDIVKLFVEIPEMQSAAQGATLNSVQATSHSVSEELRWVAAYVHRYFARTINDNRGDPDAPGVAVWHMEAVDKLKGTDYLTRSMLEVQREHPTAPPVVLPSIATPTDDWMFNLAQMTLTQLHLRV